MTNTTNPRLAGALSRVAAAGLATRHTEIETPDGPIRLIMIGTGQQRFRGSKPHRAAERRGIEPEHEEQKPR